MRNIRGSPPYFEKCKKDLFAMRRQLGNPTWFWSFSAAETRWSHLLKTMGRLVEKEDYTDCEIENMTWQQKSDLSSQGPCNVCQKLWTHGSAVIKDVLKSDEMHILGKSWTFFYRSSGISTKRFTSYTCQTFSQDFESGSPNFM